MNKFLFWLEKYLAACFVTLLGITFRARIRGNIPAGNVIYAFWHRDMIPLLFFRQKEGIVILISSSKDGELIAGPARVLGFQTARGSSNRGGVKAFKEIIKLAQTNSIAITPDGPKGPLKIIKPGILHLAYLTKLPIIPVAVNIQNEKVFSSWDKFRLPLPFSKVSIHYGKPFLVTAKDEIQEKSKILQEIMLDLEKTNKI
jgi:lysophospholipid acyltransferase (LPLAT)-like uncharacterized protein